MLRGSVLLAAFLVSLPTIYQALVTQSITVADAVIRFLISVVICGVLMGMVRMAMAPKPETPTDKKAGTTK